MDMLDRAVGQDRSAGHANDPKNAEWWRGAALYQIYPRSFQDSNADGIGDFRGIVQRLPYIASLGVDAIWLSSFMASPMQDFGYDVSSYRDIDPAFGTPADFDQLVATAHGLGLHVLIDLVISHTSDQHAWFAESRSHRKGGKADWYVWADPRPDGTPPNNWLSMFGGSAWSWDTRRQQYYLHNFLPSQPDLNFHCHAVQDALLEIMQFWLERGVDGFRLDTINYYFHDRLLRDNPALPQEERNATTAPSVNPYNYQDHIHSKNQPENLEFLRRIRQTTDSYRGVVVGEIGDAQRGMALLGEYTSDSDKVQMCYGFDLLSRDTPSAPHVASVLETFMSHADDGWVCWSYSNHDVVRHKSRWDLDDAADRIYVVLLVCLRGSLCLYQGEELGLNEADLSYSQLQDPYGKQFWPEFKGRDGCRTPMVWSDETPHAGFSTAHETWLPIAGNHLAKAVSCQDGDPASLLNHYRKVIRLRSQFNALKVGHLSAIAVTDDRVLSFQRSSGNEIIFCAFNLSEQSIDLAVPAGEWDVIGGAVGAAQDLASNRVVLKRWQPFLARKVKQ